MLVLLQLLQQALDQCADGSHDASHISGICLQLQVDVPRTFREYTSAELAAIDFLRYHRGLVALYKWALAMADSIVVLSVWKLLTSHERLFADLIPPREPLPDFHVKVLQHESHRELRPTIEKLKQKEVPPTLLAEIGHALTALFTEGKAPMPVYHHRTYLPEFIGMLRQLAEDQRTKDWPKRFMEAMVNYNFNYMGFFNRWKEHLSDEMERAWAEGRADEVLRRCQETVELYHTLPLAFDPNRPSLKVLMETTVAHLWESLSDTGSNSHPLRTNALAGDIAVRFHYRHKAGEFDYDTQQEAARDFTNAHLSKTGQPVSAHTLTKFDKSALYGPALRYRRQLIKELELLEKDFKLNKTENR
ncbi:hypothetical protein GCM10011386_11430 [Parapedobacter defluvii]|uniref:Uncharacterized protein n=1 Tax=Parapedobacter defluvii TaxID=2045106 RepID=A0ABQ1L8N8_9SPHI|nr:hypothetical protein [Parapedobacter defluvii]GGC21206.1 hypothetical protein GCM10011386_11430 [Parapedobacter defluvii]